MKTLRFNFDKITIKEIGVKIDEIHKRIFQDSYRKVLLEGFSGNLEKRMCEIETFDNFIDHLFEERKTMSWDEFKVASSDGLGIRI